MKWGIAILLILGLVAAASAALLMGTLNIGSSASGEEQSEKIEVAMAKVSLPAMTVVTLRHINTEMVSRDELPQGPLASPARIIGRVLSVPVVEGQILTDSCFVPEGAGALLAAAIPHGMRAVTVSVSSKSMPDSILLYPGCVVDVLVAYRLSTRSSGQALSTTMLRGIQVIAVEGESVISNPDVEEESGTKKRSTSRGTLVTLLVDTRQAEALHLAVENGNLSLSVRNPLDKEIFELEGTVLSQDRLADQGNVLTPTVQNEQDLEVEQPLGSDTPQEQTLSSNNPQDSDREGSIFGAMPPKKIVKYQKSPRWGVIVFRGPEKKLEEFETSGNESDGTAPKK